MLSNFYNIDKDLLIEFLLYNQEHIDNIKFTIKKLQNINQKSQIQLLLQQILKDLNEIQNSAIFLNLKDIVKLTNKIIDIVIQFISDTTISISSNTIISVLERSVATLEIIFQKLNLLS